MSTQKFAAGKIAVGFLSLVLIAPAGLSLAQDAPPPAPVREAPQAPQAAPGHTFGPGPGRAVRDGQRGARRMPENPFRGVRADKYVEGRIAFLKAELKITDAQSRQWERFAAYLRESAKTRVAAAEAAATVRRERPAPGQPRERKPLVERLGDQESRLQGLLDQARKRKEAVEALYKVLGDEQKALAEELL